MKHALVTGATGGLGRELVSRLLRQGFRVRATGRNAFIGRELEQQGASFVACDLRERTEHLVDGVDTVFHLAALTAPWGVKKEFQLLNVDATAALLAGARARGCQRFIYASTPSIYADRDNRLCLTETSSLPKRFANRYAATKYAAENMVHNAHTPTFQTIALRPRAIVGPDDQVLLPRLRRFIDTGRIPLPGGGNALIELTDVRDVADAFIAAGRCSDTGGMAVNLSGGKPRKVCEVVAALCQMLGVQCRLVSVPVQAAMAWAAFAETLALITGHEPSLTRSSVMALAWSQTFDLSLASSLLHWQPRYSPEEALQFAVARHA